MPSSSLMWASGIAAVALLLHLPQLGMTHDHRVQHRVILEGELVLAQLTEPLIGVDADIARARLKVAAQNLHQRRLARALGPELHGDAGSRNQSGTSQTRLTLYRGRATKRGPIGQWTALRPPGADREYRSGWSRQRLRIQSRRRGDGWAG